MDRFFLVSKNIRNYYKTININYNLTSLSNLYLSIRYFHFFLIKTLFAMIYVRIDFDFRCLLFSIYNVQ